jgi:hypothetical protein
MELSMSCPTQKKSHSDINGFIQTILTQKDSKTLKRTIASELPYFESIFRDL